MQDCSRPLYPIGIVAELLNVHPETLRQWENFGVIKVNRRGGKRYFSENDLKRLKFLQQLMDEGLNLPAIRHYLKLYPCWENTECPNCMKSSKVPGCAKPCWKEQGSFCWLTGEEQSCTNCTRLGHGCGVQVEAENPEPETRK